MMTRKALFLCSYLPLESWLLACCDACDFACQLLAPASPRCMQEKGKEEGGGETRRTMTHILDSRRVWLFVFSCVLVMQEDNNNNFYTLSTLEKSEKEFLKERRRIIVLSSSISFLLLCLLCVGFVTISSFFTS